MQVAQRTRPREQWRGVLPTLQFIVPSPMSAPTGQQVWDVEEEVELHILDDASGIQSQRRLHANAPCRLPRGFMWLSAVVHGRGRTPIA